MTKWGNIIIRLLYLVIVCYLIMLVSKQTLDLKNLSKEVATLQKRNQQLTHEVQEYEKRCERMIDANLYYYSNQKWK